MKDSAMVLAEDLDKTTAVVVAHSDALVAGETQSQLAAAHSYPRSVSRFLKESQGLATLSVEVAESCMYSLPRGGKNITGPSIRLAEIMASSYGNLQVASRIVGVEATEVVAQGMAWDMEKNLRCVAEVRRRITNKNGSRYNDDMITITGNAAASIALRNAVFRVVPRAYVDSVFDVVRKTAVGEAKTLPDRRAKILERLQKMGVSQERVLSKLEVRGVDDITLEHLEFLIGLGTAIKSGDAQIDEAFPIQTAPIPAENGKRMSLRRDSQPEVPEREPGQEG